MNEKIDVLAVWDEAIASAEGDYVPEPVDIRKMHAARAAIAELIEAAKQLRGLTANGGTTPEWRAANIRMDAALAAVGGAK